jgi:hypothetical protein
MDSTKSPSRLVEELSRLDWTAFDAQASSRCLLALGVTLGGGLLFHYPAAGIVATGGALSVGLSSFRKLQGSRLLPMLLTLAGTFAAATLGTLIGRSSPLTIFATGLLGLFYGLLLLFSEDASWIGLRCVITFLVASAFPAEGWHALLRGLLVLFGGSLQGGILLAFWHGREIPFLNDEWRACHPARVLHILWREIAPTLLRHVHHRLPHLRYAVRLALTLMVAVSLSHLLHQLNRYWIPLTTLLVMKPDFYRTYTSAVGRVLGTFLGVLLASLLTLGLHPNPLLVWALVLVFAWNLFAWQKVNYAIFSCAITAFIVFLIATAGLPEITATANRLLDTALGSVLALGSRALGPRWDSALEPKKQSGPAPTEVATGPSRLNRTKC